MKNSTLFLSLIFLISCVCQRARAWIYANHEWSSKTCTGVPIKIEWTIDETTIIDNSATNGMSSINYCTMLNQTGCIRSPNAVWEAQALFGTFITMSAVRSSAGIGTTYNANSNIGDPSNTVNTLLSKRGGVFFGSNGFTSELDRTMSSNVMCVDTSRTNPRQVTQLNFWPSGAIGRPYFIVSQYDPSAGRTNCSTIVGDNQVWTRTALMADGVCRSVATKVGSRYQRISCQFDGSGYVQDYCDSSCTFCTYQSLVDVKTCGFMGDLEGNRIVIGGYCGQPTRDWLFPSGTTPGKYRPPPQTGVQIKNGSNKVTPTFISIAFTILASAYYIL